MVMSLGYALTEDFPWWKASPPPSSVPWDSSAPTRPPVEAIIVEANQDSELGYGAVGIGEIHHPSPPRSCRGAYYKMDGQFRTTLPLEYPLFPQK